MTEQQTYDYLFKFIIIGDAATGKSCILHRFIDDRCICLQIFFQLQII